MSDTPRRRGRQPTHVDGADRQAAYRQRLAAAAAKGEAALHLIEHPTPALVATLAAKLVDQGADPIAAVEAVARALIEEIERRHGHNVAQALRNAMADGRRNPEETSE